ncbi:MAG: porphobilinogen synthase, partial [Simkaniaceae bacterium]|nr:porphobilinogen synthase [Simkaniaceae bacterium]
MFKRPRRNRSLESLRMLIQENHLHASDLVAPLFLIEGTNKKSAIKKMPGIYRKSLDCLLEEAEELHRMGVQGIALFPVIETSLKNEMATESYNENGLIPIAIKAIKKEIPSLCLFTDVALDPYTSHGHDGIVNSQKQVDNDKTLEVLIKQALTHAKAGVDFIAPSDMMDGR